MKKPSLIVVTGSPASGKTTLASILSSKINCPLISRDQLKEGYINTLKVTHNQLDKSVDWYIYNVFFDAIDLFISKGISIIIEAAFQDQLWRPKLLSLLDKTEIKIIICNANLKLIKARFNDRLLNNPDREKFHGDQLASSSKDYFISITKDYKPVNINVPTLQVDTTENYNPVVEDIINFINLNQNEDRNQ
ncbi:MAG: AAA family ATPase [Ferruginibacter sp.]